MGGGPASCGVGRLRRRPGWLVGKWGSEQACASPGLRRCSCDRVSCDRPLHSPRAQRPTHSPLRPDICAVLFAPARPARLCPSVPEAGGRGRG